MLRYSVNEINVMSTCLPFFPPKLNLKLETKDELSSPLSNDVNQSESDIVTISDVVNGEITNAKENNTSRIKTDAILGGLGIG